MRNKYASNYVLLRNGIYYYLRRVRYNLTDHYHDFRSRADKTS